MPSKMANNDVPLRTFKAELSPSAQASCTNVLHPMHFIIFSNLIRDFKSPNSPCVKFESKICSIGYFYQLLQTYKPNHLLKRV